MFYCFAARRIRPVRGPSTDGHTIDADMHGLLFKWRRAKPRPGYESGGEWQPRNFMIDNTRRSLVWWASYEPGTPPTTSSSIALREIHKVTLSAKDPLQYDVILAMRDGGRQKRLQLRAQSVQTSQRWVRALNAAIVNECAMLSVADNSLARRY